MNTNPLSQKAQQTLEYLQKLVTTLPLFQRLTDDMTAIQEKADHFRQFQDVLILGTGGSSLGGQAITALQESASPKLHFLDNIDAHTFADVLKTVSPHKTGVIAISKSGNTAETLMQLLTCLKVWDETPLAHHFLIVSEPGQNAIREVASKFSLPTLDHPDDIGGRFSAFTVVGMLPAFIAGIDGQSLRQGALDVLANLKEATVHDSPALVGALTQFSLCQQHVNQSVLFTYCDRLQLLASWYCQLWAESVGKKNAIGLAQGTTPIRAAGATDQHSQLQLYLDGPRDKFFTVLTLAQQHSLDSAQADFFDHPALTTLHNKTMGQLMIAEQMATIDTLKANNCPVRELKLEQLTPRSLGSLMMHFILETLAMAHLLEVNPFDQPAVEQGKKLALDYLSRAGGCAKHGAEVLIEE
ncbi:glucose-6-phosphate isomerase [Candidatus Finniella inopinata]|uniref:Glucose-6-phosphate isomerase n=1 Tax=Candidatus Finniella inopinata TaxID=1696036 RepID=A0A4Q7DH54_9PROT|nr:glucose-6-phosphate isomerase [Candidatus Finniella inopinata]RZI45640.1 glucose-6-phosphate isomerase [Candidatus Finniella inopinata]